MEARLILNRLANRLAEKQIETARLDANLILQMALGLDERILMHHEIALSQSQQDELERLMAKRMAGCPVSRLKGEREFYSLTFGLNNATLDPRPDSEILVEAAISYCQNQKQKLAIADFGTGSGCLLLSVLYHHKEAKGLGLDISEEAIKMAQDNASSLGLSERVHFIASDWDEGLDDETRFDVILSNPPYIAEGDRQSLAIEVASFDPERALFAGDDGLDAYRLLMPILCNRLNDGGVGFIEIGQNQEDDVIDLANKAGLEIERLYKDLGGIIRCLKFRKNK